MRVVQRVPTNGIPGGDSGYPVRVAARTALLWWVVLAVAAWRTLASSTYQCRTVPVMVEGLTPWRLCSPCRCPSARPLPAGQNPTFASVMSARSGTLTSAPFMSEAGGVESLKRSCEACAHTPEMSAIGLAPRARKRRHAPKQAASRAVIRFEDWTFWWPCGRAPAVEEDAGEGNGSTSPVSLPSGFLQRIREYHQRATRRRGCCASNARR